MERARLFSFPRSVVAQRTKKRTVNVAFLKGQLQPLVGPPEFRPARSSNLLAPAGVAVLCYVVRPQPQAVPFAQHKANQPLSIFLLVLCWFSS